jgi:parvulin-like peptidyl-prolyl isomerase
MRKSFQIGLIAFGLILGGNRPSDAALMNGITAIVNDSVITYDEVESSLAPIANLLASQFGNQPQVFRERLQKARQERVEELVERQLVLHEFKTAGYNLPESIVDDIIRDQIRQQFGDRVTLTKTLQARGRTFESFRKQKREDLIVELLSRKQLSSEKILISPFKIEQFYQANQENYKVGDQVKLRMIGLTKNPDSAAQVRKIAEEIRTKVKEGASFAEMASVYAEGAQRARGGDRGWVERKEFKKELADAAFSLKPGETSEVIDLPEACYLLHVEQVRPAHVRPLEEVRGEIETTLRSQEGARLHKKWISRLKKKSFVRYYL